jgi:CBS domain containing-hemolysin-like protein
MLMWGLTLLLGIGVVLLITAATGYFVAQEFAYMAVDRSRLNARAAAGDTGAKRALAVTKRTSFMLSGAQLGITVTALLVGYVAEPLIGESLGTALGGFGIPTGVGIAIGTVLALVFSTFVQMLLGELFPKNLAIARPEPIAVGLATSTTWYLRLFGWLIWVFDGASNLLLRALRIEPVHDVEHSASARDLEHIVADSRESGDLPEELSVLLDRILDFPERDAEHAMIPRARVDVLRTDDTIGGIRTAMASGHSRYPVLDTDEQVVGVVHLQDLLDTPLADGSPAAALMRAPVVVPSSMPLPHVLRQLVTEKNQLACVIDEYGGLAGVVTVEDLAEELVGEITDEHDPTEPAYVPVEDDGTWVMAGEIHIDEVERSVGYDLPRGDYETIAGLIIAEHGSFPEVGTVVTVTLPPDPADLVLSQEPPVRRLDVEVLAIDRHVPATVRVSLQEPSTQPADGEMVR